MNQKALIIILVVALLIVLGTSAAVVWLLPSAPNAPGQPPPAVSVAPLSAVPSAADSFSTAVLDRSDYLSLDQKLIQQGSIPVQPPQGAGKANPFF